MKTEISRFCESYLHTVSTLPAAIKTAAETLESAPGKPQLQGPLATLNDVRARLRSLVEKLESQQAYLLIFGPLKSGKSTLMNAISGSYVSEVTSLPGYPCLVYVRHAEQPRFSVTRYNGRESIFGSGAVLKDVIADSHVALAEQIRLTEEAGVQFDPGINFNEAIRRADVSLPVQALAESGTVLVDTPGLYSRMKFGYDVLAREFRNSASCAVFVVKTDNLFLEQVFAEFNQLLGLFSRIFLVINVDSQKRDLQADGSLRPSAESEHPEQIIEAFKTLSMAGPLRQAYKDGRLRIHAVDLLSAASSFLARNGTGTADPESRQFNTFLGDLTDYLNSSDYTQEFIRDSLRQGESLCLEARSICGSETIAELAAEQEQLAGEMRALDEQLAAVERLQAVAWDATFAQVRKADAQAVSDRALETAQALGRELRTALERWMASDESLRALVDSRWNPALTAAGRALAAESRDRLHRALGNALGGAEPAAAVMSDLHSAGFKLAPIADLARRVLDAPEVEEGYRSAITQDEVPVRKSFGDWVLFRRLQTVRRRLFGEDSSQTIAPEIKARRLAEQAQSAFEKKIDESIARAFPAQPAKYADGLLAAYVSQFSECVKEQLAALHGHLTQQKAVRRVPFEANARILAAVEALKDQAATVLGEIDTLIQAESPRPAVVEGAALAEAPAPTATLEYTAA